MQADSKRGLGLRSVAFAAIVRPVNSFKTTRLQFERQVVQLAQETAVAEDLAGVKSPADIACLMFARATALHRTGHLLWLVPAACRSMAGNDCARAKSG